MLTPEQYAALVAADMTEAALQSKVEQVARTLGWLTYHTHNSRRSAPGFPDLVLVRRSRVLYRELKTEKGRTSPAQREWLAALAAAGQDVALWRPSDLVSGRVAADLEGG